jgi:maltose alpha-D-glucosyltransferase/alpha-amylase
MRDVVVEDAVPLRHPDTDVALLVVRVAFTEGDDHRYAVPVMRATGRLATVAAGDTPTAIIAALDDGDLLVDAMAGPDGAMAVVQAALQRRVFPGRHRGAARGLPRRTGIGRLVQSSRDVLPLGVEQSNSSALVSHELIAKLVRRIEPGANPDVELPAHLTTQGFGHVPGVAATLELDLHGESAPADVVIVHEAITNEGDLWAWMLDELAVGIEHHNSFGGGIDQTLWLAELLGRRTAELHTALAASDGHDGMTPQPFTLLWQRSLLQSLRNGVRATQRALRRAKIDGAAAQVVLAPVDDVLARFEPLRTVKLDARRIRVHGDLHLGQILRSGNDITFIDFEGEPGRPIGERRIMRSPLIDVAGLLRSIDYAGRSALDTAVDRGLVAEADLPDLDAGRDRWTSQVCGTITDAYLTAASDVALVPADRQDADMLLDVYMLQKGLYEVRYELANRPDWVHWPLSAVAEMINR